MALALESSQQVWLKVEHALLNAGATQTGASPVAQDALLSLKNYLVSKGINLLQFVPYSEVDADDADGTGLLDAACTIFAFYVKKEASATANTVKLFESATVDTTATEQSLSMPLAASGQESFQIYPNGWAQATGTTITQHTTIEGSTDGSNGGNGFLIVGAA